MEDPNNKTILMLKATKSIKKTTESSRNFKTCKNNTSTLHPQTMGEDFKTLDN